MKRYLGLGITLFYLSACSSLHRAWPPEDPARNEDGRSFYVATERLNLRKCPEQTCAVTQKLQANQVVIQLELSDDWIKVYIPENKTSGWVVKRYLRSTPLTEYLLKNQKKKQTPGMAPASELETEVRPTSDRAQDATENKASTPESLPEEFIE
jgi:uncharacterized protein YgiM (DUF1202 family)